MNWINLVSLSVAGAFSGTIIAWSMDFRTPKELLQGAVGGVIVGVIMTFLLPQ